LINVLMSFMVTSYYHIVINRKEEVRIVFRLDSFKDLGVTFQSDMSFKLHIANQINKANSMLGIIKSNFRDIKQDTFIVFVSQKLSSFNVFTFSAI